MHSIPISGVENESEFLKSLSPNVLPKGASLSQRKVARGVNLDPATLALIIGDSKEILVAAISAIGSVWAATVAARARSEKGDQARSSEPSPTIPEVEIDTVSDTYTIVADQDLAKRIQETLPDKVNNVLNIRLTRTRGIEGR
jgi:hypothetical protein